MKLVPGLTEAPHGREVLLSFNKDIGSALKLVCKIDEDEDAMILAKADKLVRRVMFQKQAQFSGTFEEDCQKRSVPQNLVTLVEMILEGPNIDQQTEMKGDRDKPVYSICQLLVYNSVEHKRSKQPQGNIRYNVTRETPLPMYNGLKLHVKSHKKQTQM